MRLEEVIVLAGGKGTRLRQIVSDVPKPMAKICGKPFLELLLDLFIVKGIKHFVLSVGYKSDVIVEHFKDKYPGVKVSFSHEDNPLGTGGAIKRAFEHIIGDKAVILNGDSLFDIDLTLLNSLTDQDCPIIYGRYVDDVSRYGKFSYHGNKIYQFTEKSAQGSGYINGGVYVLKKNTFDTFEKDKFFSIEKDLFACFSKENMATLVCSDGYFIDIGVPDSYQKAQDSLTPYIKNKALFLDRDGVINIDSHYLCRPEECTFINGVGDLLKYSKSLGYLNIVVTNQSGIGRGYFSEDMFHDFMAWMNNQLGGLIDDYFFCPYHPEHGVGAYKRESWDRKPNPGMFEKAVKKHNVIPELSLMIGDNVSDLEAAQQVNIAQSLLLTSDNCHQSTFNVIKYLSSAHQYL